ncbi:MAG: hypothetical protein ACRERE_34160 [Candidatus Entotheonellia bacterium]
MELHSRIFMVAVLAITLIVVGVGFHPHDVLAKMHRSIGPALPYAPDCARRDPVCMAWTEFRRARPYPYQTFAIKPLADASLAIIISEPAPVFAKADLEKLIRAAFGGDLRALKRLRWKIGIDGWVEDLVLTINAPSAVARAKGQMTQRDPLDDPILRDRIALLHLALFGTTYGGRLEPIGAASVETARSSASNLSVSAKELHDWLIDPATVWRPVDHADTPSLPWARIAEEKASGAFTSEDGSLVILTFPTERLSAAQADVRSLNPLRADFRRFAVASDAVLGGVWTPKGQTAILARARIKPLEMLPPLRFETFALLAVQSSNELHQSYERTHILAGKMMTGNYKGKDWAPIYLSEPLIDTEFGALLNITDQMLKSWSQAGSTEYVYFTYPLKPDKFPFGQEPLSQILQSETGSRSVLFNWNTAGSAVAAQLPDLTVLAAKQTGALPITYGSDLKPGGGIETGHLLRYEEQAYQYFADLKDPNLARVVQYTLMYQLFRAIATDQAAQHPGMIKDGPPKDFVIKARADSTVLLIAETAKLLANLQSGELEQVEAFAKLLGIIPAEADLAGTLAKFRAQHPEIDNPRFARLLADPRSEQSAMIAEAARLETVFVKLGEEQEAFRRDVQKHNETAQNVKAEVEQWFEQNARQLPPGISSLEGALPHLPAVLRAKIERLQARRQALDQREKALEDKELVPLRELKSRRMLIDDADEVRQALSDITFLVHDLEAVRRDFIARNTVEPAGWIKTPSVVLSWNRHDSTSVGGHNLKARALRLEPARDVSDLALMKTEHGLVLRYNPSRADAVAAKGSDLARAIEHGKIRNVEDLAKILEGPVEARARFAALEIPPRVRSPLEGPTRFGADLWEGRLGTRIYTEKKPFVDDLRTIAEKNDCCVFVARDKHLSTYITESNAKPPPPILIREARDTPSLSTYLKEVAGKKNPKRIVFFDQPPEHVQALTLNFDTDTTNPGKLMQFARRLGAKPASRMAERPSLSVVDLDLNGRPSFLRVMDTSGKPREPTFIGRLMDRIGVFRPAQSWHTVRVTPLEPRSLEALVRPLGWKTGRDGIPTGVMMSFEPGGVGPQRLDLTVVAGFNRKNLAAGRDQLLAAHTKSLKYASEKGATIEQHLMTLKNELEALPDVQMQRLMGILHKGETETLFSRLETDG